VMVEELNVLTDRVRVLTQGEITGGRYEVFEVLGAAGGGAPLHRHPWDEEVHVVEGAGGVLFGGSCQTCGPGGSLRVPAGVFHGFRVGPEGARFLAVTSPTGASGLFRDLHQAGSGKQLTPADVVQIASRHGVELPAPPAR